MRIYKEIVQPVQVAVGYKCDCCGKESDKYMPHLRTEHFDWGNDSGDSIKDYEYCSMECYK